MKGLWTSKRSLLFLLFIFLSSLLVFTRHFLEKNTLIHKGKADFSQILQKKELWLRGFSKDSLFVNAGKKIELLETILVIELEKLLTILEEDDWEKNLASWENPFLQSTGVFIARRSKLVFHSGNPMTPPYEKDFAKKFLALSRNRNALPQASSYLYTIPPTREEFEHYHGDFQTIFLRTKMIHRYYLELKNFTLLVLTDLEKITPEMILERIDTFFCASESSLSLQNHGTNRLFYGNTLIEEYPKEPVSKSTFDFIIKPVVLTNTILDLSIPLGVLLGIFLLLIFTQKEYLVFTRYEIKLSALYLLYGWFLYLLLDFSLIYFQDGMKNSLIHQYESLIQKKVLQTEREFPDFMNSLEKKISSEFHAGENGLKTARNLNLLGCIFKKDKQLEFDRDYKNDTRAIPRNIMLSWGPQIIARQEDSPFKSAKEVENFYPEIELLRNEKHMDEAKLEENIEAFKDSMKGKFQPWRAFIQGMYFLWDKKGKDREFEFLFVGASQLIFEELFSKNIIQLHKSETFPFHLCVKTPRNPTIWEKSDPSFKNEQISRLEYEYKKMGGRIFAFKKNNTDYLGIFIPSSGLLRQMWFLYAPQNSLFHPVFLLHSRYRFFLPLLLGFMSIFGWILARKILLPISLLKEGLINARQGNYKKHLPVPSKDEGGEMISQFNLMQTMLAQKEEMLPFVSKNVIELLGTQESNTSNFSYIGQCCVLFSDIRSFTSISESNEPEEVVSMLNDYFTLWQTHADAHGGIIDSFIGDAIRIVWFEKKNPHYLQNAIQTAIQVYEDLKNLNQSRKQKNQFLIQNGVGIACGKIRFSIVGSENKLEFLLLGDAVETAAILESDSKTAKFSRIITDEFVYTTLKWNYDFEKFYSPTLLEKNFYELKIDSQPQ